MLYEFIQSTLASPKNSVNKVRKLRDHITLLDSSPSDFAICPKRLLWEGFPTQDALQDDRWHLADVSV